MSAVTQAPTPPRLEVVAELLTADVPSCGPHERVGAVRAALLGRRFESAREVAVLEGERLVGLLRIEDLLAAPAERTAADLMDPDPPRIAPGTDREVAAWRAVQHREGSLAVVDAEGGFLGLVPPYRLLGWLLEAHEEDMARLGGFM